MIKGMFLFGFLYRYLAITEIFPCYVGYFISYCKMNLSLCSFLRTLRMINNLSFYCNVFRLLN